MGEGSGHVWIEICAEALRIAELPQIWLKTLQAFSNPYPRGGAVLPSKPMFWSGDLDSLLTHLRIHYDEAAIQSALLLEVDGPQGAIFQRRLETVLLALARRSERLFRILEVGMRVRLAEILCCPVPKALRIRALADFYYSQIAWADVPAQASNPAEIIARQAWQPVAKGLSHLKIDEVTTWGPTHLNLLRVDLREIRLDVVDRHGTAAKIPFVEACQNHGALAGVSGGFFLYSEPDIQGPSARFDPVGMLITADGVVNPPIFSRGALFWDKQGCMDLKRISLLGFCVQGNFGQIEVQEWWNRAKGKKGGHMPSIAIAKDEITAVGMSLEIPLNGVVVAVDDLAPYEVGQRITWQRPEGRVGNRLSQALAGGPLLVADGQVCIDYEQEDFWGTAPPITFSQDETGDRNLLPRLGVGLLGDHHLLFIAVDGRHFQRAVGSTLGQLAQLFIDLGVHRACNLDGGSSKRMVVGHEMVDLSSTELEGAAAGKARQKLRPVHTAIMLHAKEQ